MKEYFIGLMSGTSADAIDAVLVDFSDGIHLVHHLSRPYPPGLQTRIKALAQPGEDEINRALELDTLLGEAFAQAACELLTEAGVSASQVRAIGSHGQTIRHRPAADGKTGFSWQIADANIIAERTAITTVADFRRRDIAAGGQGAPLVPGFHRTIFHSPGQDRAIVNIGGIANITWLPAQGTMQGFDTGPGNTLMDTWIKHHLGQPYDHDGNWAQTGTVDTPLLDTLLQDPYFHLPAPKSTGPEYFNSAWLQTYLHSHPASATNVQTTLLGLTATTIADNIMRLSGGKSTEVFVCGGGAHNSALMRALESALPGCSVKTTAALGIDPQQVEAIAFAWLARQTLAGKPGNPGLVTGAGRECVLGAIYPA